MANAGFMTKAELGSVDVADIRAVLQTKKPAASPGDVDSIAQIIVVVLDAVNGLSKAQRLELVKEKKTLRAAIRDMYRRRRKKMRERPAARDDVERRVGTGLGDRIGLEEGRERLDLYVTPMPLENWAGPTAGAGGVEHELGIPRSTLGSWRQKGSVVGLLRGERKLAYPLEQFVDARPLEGLADVLKVAPDARSAWLWLRQPHVALGDRSPLDVLKAGGRSDVALVAGRDFS